MANDEQPSLFGDDHVAEDWRRHWQGMPEYESEDLTPYRTAKIHFSTEADIEAFEKLTGLNLGRGTMKMSGWYPPVENVSYAAFRYVDETEPEDGG